jgi:hypothetical protein
LWMFAASTCISVMIGSVTTVSVVVVSGWSERERGRGERARGK